MSRFAPRARVLKRGDHWLAILPGGRRVTYTRWWLAMHYANQAVEKEMEYDRLKDTGLGPQMGRQVRKWNEPRDPAWRAWSDD